MERRQFMERAAILGCAGVTSLIAQTPASRPARAIAEGGPLTPPADRPVRVAVAVSAGTTWIDFVGPLAVFETFQQDATTRKFKRCFTSFLVSEKLEPAGNLVPDHTFDTAPAAEVVLVPAQPDSPAMLEWLKRAAPTTDVTMSVCTGARHLAKAGLIDGQRATTHHGAIAQFTRDYPSVTWLSGMRFVEGPRFSTGGGLTAGIDLALRVTERYYGRAAAQAVAEHLEYQGTGWIV